MTKRLVSGLLLALLTTFPLSAQNTDAADRAAAARLLAFGRANLTATGEAASLTAALSAHKATLQADASLRRTVAARAFRDATGRTPSDAELATWSSGAAVTYTEVLKAVTDWLGTQPAEYRATIHRAYQLVIKRQAYDEEFPYWQPFGTLPYVVLVGAIENWGLRNQPGLMLTTGTASIAVTSRFLTTQRVSLPVANEIRPLLGLRVWTDVARLHNPGRNIVALGAQDIESVGGVHFLLAGGGPLAGE